MNLDIKKSFLSPFSEEKWYLKLIFPVIVTAFSIVSNHDLHASKETILLVSLLSIIPSIILSGFFMQFEHNEIHDELPLLPILNSNVKKYLIYGLNALGIVLIYILFLFLTAIGIGAMFALLHIAKILSIILVGIFLIFIFLFVGFAESTYADYFSFKKAMNVSRIASLIPKVKTEIFIYILITIGLMLTLSIITAGVQFAKATLILIPFFTTLIQLIMVNLKAQVYKVAKYRLETKEELS